MQHGMNRMDRDDFYTFIDTIDSIEIKKRLRGLEERRKKWEESLGVDDEE